MGFFSGLGKVLGGIAGAALGPIGVFAGQAIGEAAGSAVEGSTSISGQAAPGSSDFDPLGALNTVTSLVNSQNKYNKEKQKEEEQPTSSYVPESIASSTSGFDLTRYTPKPIDPTTGLPIYDTAQDELLPIGQSAVVGRGASEIITPTPQGVIVSQHSGQQPNLPQIQVSSAQRHPNSAISATPIDPAVQAESASMNIDLLKVAETVGRLYSAYDTAVRANKGKPAGFLPRAFESIDAMRKVEAEQAKIKRDELEKKKKVAQVRPVQNPDGTISYRAWNEYGQQIPLEGETEVGYKPAPTKTNKTTNTNKAFQLTTEGKFETAFTSDVEQLNKQFDDIVKNEKYRGQFKLSKANSPNSQAERQKFIAERLIKKYQGSEFESKAFSKIKVPVGVEDMSAPAPLFNRRRPVKLVEIPYNQLLNYQKAQRTKDNTKSKEYIKTFEDRYGKPQ